MKIILKDKRQFTIVGSIMLLIKKIFNVLLDFLDVLVYTNNSNRDIAIRQARELVGFSIYGRSCQFFGLKEIKLLGNWIPGILFDLWLFLLQNNFLSQNK
jgi:hypothetical protein